MKKTLLLALTAVLCGGSLFAQKKALDQSVYDDWNSIAATKLTDNGEWAFYQIKPQVGDPVLEVMRTSDRSKTRFERGSAPTYFNNGEWMTFQILAPYAETRQAKIDKKKKDEMPGDTLAVLQLESGALTTLPQAKNVATAAKGALLLYSREVTPEADTTDKEAPKPKKFDRLVIWNVATGDSTLIDSVKSFKVNELGNLVLYTTESDSLKSVYAYTPLAKKPETHLLWSAPKGQLTSSLVMDKKGTQGAFLVSTDTVDHALYDLFYFSTKGFAPKQITDASIQGLIPGYAVSRFGALAFNEEGTRLQFNTAPKPVEIPKDTLPKGESFSLDVWSWNDTIIQSQQIADVKKLREKSYTAVYYPTEDRALALGNYDLDRIVFAENPDAPFALGLTSKPYMLHTGEDIQRYVGSDVYLIELATGKKTQILTNSFGGTYLSPSSEWVVYASTADTLWHSINTRTLQYQKIARDIPYPMYNEDEDHPVAAPMYGMMGWTTDEKLLMPDRYDVWLADPAGVKPSENLTKIGRETNTQFRFVNPRKVPGKAVVDIKDPMLFLSFDRVDKENGYYLLNQGKPIQKLVEGPYIYKILSRALEGDDMIYSRENFNEYPNLWLAEEFFVDPVQFTDVNPQQADYKWGSVELVNWVDFNGNECEGLLHFPEDYDPSKAYPTIVYFYEKQTFLLYRYNTPAPSRSIINPVYCTSNDYIVFIPDIRYHDGFPGKSCYDVVVSGTMALIDRGIADPKRVGLQGQSWGGYQSAYLVTQTDIFACSAPGTPVSNMISAYGGIRWITGISRAYQYEVGQSRIGATPWQRRDLYIDNSPIFFADRVNTPQLIRHCDEDGAVPWYQSIEFFVALRRMGKPVWFLNYNGDGHNLMERGACMDWDKRMYQFFDYYLKGAAMPRWMKEGIKSTEKGIDQKLDLTEEVRVIE